MQIKKTALCKLIIRALGQKKNVSKNIIEIPNNKDFSLSTSYIKKQKFCDSKHIILIILI
jgi:hypothetical protein